MPPQKNTYGVGIVKNLKAYLSGGRRKAYVLGQVMYKTLDREREREREFCFTPARPGCGHMAAVAAKE